MSITKYPQNITQTTGIQYRKFKNLNNLKNSSDSYTISELPILENGTDHYTPSNITCKNFNFQLPQGSRVKKIIVEYRHMKIGHHSPSGDPRGFHPDYDSKKAPNLPAPWIDVLGVAGARGTGQAPALTAKSHTKVFKGDWSASSVNSSGFGVRFEYYPNMGNTLGYVRLKYIRIRLEYVTANFSIVNNKVNGGVNGQEYSFDVTVSNLNKTDVSPECTITVPSGFTFKSSSENVTREGGTIVWKPKFTNKIGSKTLRLTFDTNVTFISGEDSKTFRFTSAVSSYGVSAVHDAVIRKPSNEDTEGDPTDVPTSTETSINMMPLTVDKVTVNDEFYYNFIIDDAMRDEIIEEIFKAGQATGRWGGETLEDEYDNILRNSYIMFLNPDEVDDWMIAEYLSKDGLLSWWSDYDDTWNVTPVDTSFYRGAQPVEDPSVYLKLKGTGSGYSEIVLLAIYEGTFSMFTHQLGRWRFDIRPLESDLTIPSFSKLTLTEEEQDRLGDTYPYTAETTMKVHNQVTDIDDTTTHTLSPSSSSAKTLLVSDALTLPLQFELTFDMKTDRVNQYSDPRFQLASVSHYQADTNQSFQVLCGFSHQQLIEFGERDNVATSAESGPSYEINTWYSFRIVRDYDTFSFYVDDTFLGSRNVIWFDDEAPYYLSLLTFANGAELTVKNILLTYQAESYVRDWYKNFRIGIFNNRIEENCTDYITYDTTDTTQSREMIISSRFDLTDTSFVISTDKAVNITIGETVHELSDNDSITLTLDDWILPIELEKVNEDLVKLTTVLNGSDNTVLETTNYLVRFNQDETLEPYTTTTDTTDYDELTDEEIYTNAQYWGNAPSNINTYENITTEFQYNKNYPLILLITGDYPEATTTEQITYTEPKITENDNINDTTRTYPEPIHNTVTETPVELTLQAYETSTPIQLYNLPLPENTGTTENHIIKGIEITGDINQSSSIILNATLHTPNGEKGQRSTRINTFDNDTDEETNKFTLGGPTDLWGFSTLDLVNLEQWQIELQYQNILTDSETSINFANIQLTIYFENIEHNGVTVTIDGENLSYYGVFINNIKIPAGLSTDVDYLTIDGTDTNDPYRQNIREKTIEIEFELGDCNSLTNNTTQLNQLLQLLINEKDKYNRPIPKRIEFEHLPDVYYEYIITDTIDTDIDIDTYTIKAKLVIPAGTSYSKQNTVTNTTGYVKGLANINPVIIIKPNGTDIEIQETFTGQKLRITLPEQYNNQIIEIDCEDRTTYLKTNEDDTNPTNITQYVDFNSDWFSLKGEYQFTSTNCILQTIDYNERW